MSRFSRFATALLGAMLAFLALPSFADVTPVPIEWPPTARANVVVMRANVVELRTNVSDLAGTALVTTGSETIDVTLNANILFGKDSAVIREEARARIAEVGIQIREAGPGTLRIVGYTDDLGSEAHGLVLSKQRAEAVRAALGDALSGVEVTVEGLGEADPLVPNVDEASRAQNRRVELHYEMNHAG